MHGYSEEYPTFSFQTIKYISKYVHIYRLCGLNFLLSELEISPTRHVRSHWSTLSPDTSPTTSPLSGPLDLIGLARLRSWFSKMSSGSMVKHGGKGREATKLKNQPSRQGRCAMHG